MIHVTAHAVTRFIERVEPRFSAEEARRAIRAHERAIVTAAEFGCGTVKLDRGVRLVLDGRNVVTVLGRDQWRRHMVRHDTAFGRQ